MTMRTLLLGAAAGLVTVGAAKAADLPMTKAEAVEYVKVCTEFGEGFFYIPGTDTCLKISGEIRADYRFQDRDNRGTDVTYFKTEPRLKFDARTATEYGTLRSYIQLNMPVSAGSVPGGQVGNTGVVVDKAFIQFGGLTAGYAHTFFGIYDADYGNTIFAPYFSSQSTVNLLAYTAVFGGGFSATLSVEDGKDHRGFLYDGDAPPYTYAANGYAGQSVPDIVGQLRVDGGWGEAAIFGAAHQIRYGVTDLGLAISPGGGATLVGINDNDAPDAEWGWAVGAGVGWNFPSLWGGHIALEATYAEGASNYLGLNANDSTFFPAEFGGSDLGSGWSITGEIGINPTPAVVVNVFGSYVDYSVGDVAGVANATPVLPIGFSTNFNADFTSWVAGINATYTVVPGLTVAGEVYYQSSDPDDVVQDGVVYSQDSFDHWAGGVRIKRIF
jgi:hypothetical protein